MFLRAQKDKGIEFTNGAHTWENAYPCFYENSLHSVIVRVHYIVPSCEMIGMEFLPERDFEDLRIADYARQAICAQALNDFSLFAERTVPALRRTAKLDDPFFEEKRDNTANPR